MTNLNERTMGRRARLSAGLALAALSLAACATAPHGTRLSGPAAPSKVGKPYQVKGRWYTPAENPRYNEVGIGSWYGEQFHNRKTANGEVFDMDRVSAAHKTLPLPCLVEVTNLDNGRLAVIRVNDRGPFVDGRIIDLSKAAAQELGYQRQGTARVRVRYVGPAPAGMDARVYRASAPAPQPAPIRQAPLLIVAEQRTPQAGAYDRYAGTPFAAAVSAPMILPQAAPSIAAGGPDYLPDIRPPSRPLPQMADASDGGGYRIQAGAFADRDRAEAAVRTLSATGRAEIVPVERGGATLYRVQVTGQGQAWSARDQVASLGYSDAKVLEGQ